MEKPALPVSAMDVPVGRYVYRLADDHWWWSDEMFAIHGFEPGQVVPTTDLLMAHKHPDDLDFARLRFETALSRPMEVSCYHRIVTSQRKVRTILVAGESVAGPDGGVGELRGFFVDVTSARRQDLNGAVADAIEAVTQHRSAIEQAKGALMFAHGVDADDAFALLREASTRHNVKLNEIAARLVDGFATGQPVDSDPTRVLERMLGQVV